MSGRAPRERHAGRTDWPGELPPHWQVPPLYARYHVQLGKMLDSSRITGQHLAPYVRNIDVQWDRINLANLPMMDFSPAERLKFRLQEGDLLVCEGGEVGRAAMWRAGVAQCYYQKALHRVRAYGTADCPRFLLYVLFAASSRGVLVAGGNPNTIDHLPAEKLRVFRFPSPPVEEQQIIADFLDAKTAAIDALIAKKERLIELLQEKRQALITQAVTKGLDPSVPMRQSVEWLGRIPLHWEALELRRRWCVVDCKHRTPQYIDEGYKLVSTTEVKPGRLDLRAVSRKVCESEYTDLVQGRKPRRGDLIFSRNASLGSAAYVDTDERFCMGQDVVLITSAEESQLFLTYQLNSPVGLAQVELACVGATFKRINVSQIKGIRVAAPRPQEQHQIAAYLDAVTVRFDDASAVMRRQIKALREYRQALISAAVTGQIDVRGQPTEVAV